MAPTKRPAASSTGGKAKKAKGPAIGKICKEIASALKSSSYPKNVISMLSENMPLCLGATKEERHDFQVQVVAMAGEVLASVQADLESKITAAEGKLSSADADKTKREAAVEETKKAAEEKATLMATAKKEAETAAAELKTATQAVKTASLEQKDGDAKLTEAESKKEKLQTFIESAFVPCKDGTFTDDAAKAKGIQEVKKLAKSEGLDHALLSSLPSALEKEPAGRGTFDIVVVKQVDDEFKKRMDQLNETLAAGAPEREARAQKVSATAAELEAAKVKDTAAKDAAKAAAEASKAAVAAEKAAAKELKAFGPEMKATASELKELKGSLEEFKTGVLQSFTELVDRSSVVPEPAPEEAPVPAAEATTAS